MATDWAALFARLRRAQAALDPAMLWRAPALAFAGIVEVPALAQLREAAGDAPRLDDDWTLEVGDTADSRKMYVESGEWQATWVPFARDAGEHTLLVQRPSGPVFVYGLDPPGHHEIAPSLSAWFVGLVERLEAAVEKLPSNHEFNLALLAGISSDDFGAARAALDAGADPNAQDRIPCSALMRAAERAERFEIVSLLLDRGADMSLPAWQPPIFVAAEYDHLEIVTLLLVRGADLEQRESYYGRTPLLVAARHSLRLVELFVRRGADVNARKRLGTGANSDTRVGETSLYEAARKEPHIARFLIEHGADPNLENESSGTTPLMQAIKGRSLETVRVLLEAGADPSRADKKGRTAFAWAADTYDGSRRVPVDPHIIELLQKYAPR